MNRSECEKAIEKKLLEIRELVYAYDPNIERINMCASKDWVFAFSLNKDQTDYLLNISKRMQMSIS